MVLKVNANDFLVFLKKTTANGLVEDCKLKFTNNGLEMQHINQQRNILIDGNFPKENFDSYENTTINIKNTETLLKVLSTFGDVLINIVVKDNMVKIMDATGGIDLSQAEKVECYDDAAVEKVSNIEYDNAVVIKKSMIDTIVKRNNIIKAEQVIVELKDKKITFSIGDKIDTANTHENVTSDKECKAVFEFALFQRLASQMDMLIDLSLSSDTPSRFVENTEKHTITYYLMSSDED
jgi:hypothetical protein